jgi:hypothetical protein
MDKEKPSILDNDDVQNNTMCMYTMSENQTKTSKGIQTVAFVPIVHNFFSEVKTYDEAVEFLKKYMHHKVYDYTLNHSRKIFYSLVVYKFGKELEFSDELQTKARQVILFVLNNNIHQDDQHDEQKKMNETRRKLFKDYLVELEKYKKEDFKNYMYELGVEYNQLVEMRERLSDHPEWIESIQSLMDKILDQVIFVKGESVFYECLETLGKLKTQIIKEHLENAYWDMLLEELSIKKYDIMMKNYLMIKDILLEMRDDQDTKEILDQAYIQQLLDNDLFTEKTLASQVDFIYHKMKIYGIPIYDKLIEKSKDNLIKDVLEKGLNPESVVMVFKKTLPILQSYIEIIRIYRKQLEKSKQ